MTRTDIYLQNKGKILKPADFDKLNLWGKKLSHDNYTKETSYTVFAPEAEGEPMTITYQSLNKYPEEKYAGWESLDLGKHDTTVYAYDYSKTLEWNLVEAEDWAKDSLDEFLDDMAYEKEGPEKYYGATPRM